MKITRQNSKTGPGLSHQNPGILSGLVVQAADPRWETAEQRREELESNLCSSPKARRGMRNKRRNKGGGRNDTFQKALSSHLVGKKRRSYFIKSSARGAPTFFPARLANIKPLKAWQMLGNVTLHVPLPLL